MSKIIGIDLGTTNSCVSVIEGGEPVVIPNAEGARTTPSVVAFSKDGERMVGNVAKRQAITNPEKTISSIKRHMGSDYKVNIDGKAYTPQEISAIILQKLKSDAEAYLGEKVTEAVMDYIVAQFKSETGIDLSNDKMAMQRVKEAAEKAKIDLSGMTTAQISLPFITADATGPKHLETTLTRAKFNEMTADLVEATMGPVRQAMKDSGLSMNEIDKILLVGGSTRIPAVQEAIQKFSGKEPFKGINPDECVAMGAALQGGVLGGDVKGLLLLDVTPLSLGIETMGGVNTVIIERNTTIPTKKSQIFSTAADNQTSVEVHVLQGEREFAKDNKTLGMFHLDGILPARRGVPQIEVTFDIDANGIVHVSAKDLGTGKQQEISITASSNMSKEDIDKAVKEAEQFAEEDKKKRESVDLRNNADQMVYQTEKLISEDGDKFSADDKSALQTKVDALKEALKGDNEDAIKSAQEDLQNKFYEVSQKLYEAAQQAQGGAQAGPKGPQGAGYDPNAQAQGGGQEYTDADYTEVDDN